VRINMPNVYVFEYTFVNILTFLGGNLTLKKIRKGVGS
jgi:hypothetical protein